MSKFSDDLRRLSKFLFLRGELLGDGVFMRRQRRFHRVVRVALGLEFAHRAVQVVLQRGRLVALGCDHLQKRIHRLVHLLRRDGPGLALPGVTTLESHRRARRGRDYVRARRRLEVLGQSIALALGLFRAHPRLRQRLLRFAEFSL